MGKETPVILVNRVVDTKRIIGNNGGPRRRRGTRGQFFKMDFRAYGKVVAYGRREIGIEATIE
jgi:hypothetical protein